MGVSSSSCFQEVCVCCVFASLAKMQGHKQREREEYEQQEES